MYNFPKLLLLGFLVFNSYAQTSLAELKRQIQNVQKEIADQEKKSSLEAQRDQEYQKLSKSRLARLNQQISSVKSQKDSLSQELNKLKNTARKTKGASYWYDKKRSTFAKFLATKLDSLVLHYKIFFPYEIESQIESLEGISNRLKSDNIQPEEALDRVWSVLSETIKAGYEIESWKGSLAQPSGQLQGEYLRVGSVLQYFLVDKSDAVFILSKVDGRWKWESREFSLDERNTLRQALKVKAGQAAPQMARLPIIFNFYQATDSSENTSSDLDLKKVPQLKKKSSSAPKTASKSQNKESKK